jgi:hypothetical protein
MSEQSPLEPLDPDLRALFEAERRHPAQSAEAHARVWQTVAASVVVAPVAVGVGAALSPKAGGLAALKALGAAKLASAGVALFVAGGVVGAAVQHSFIEPHVRRSDPVEQRAQAVTREAPAADAPPALDLSAAGPRVIAPDPAPAAPPTPVEPRRSRPAPAAVAEPLDGDGVSERSSQLAREQAIIDAARAGLARGHGDDALAALARHEREFPAGSLVEEREGLRVLALARSGRASEAAEGAARFRAQYPRSMLLPAISAALTAAH